MKKPTTIKRGEKLYNYRRTPHHTGFLVHFRAPGIRQCVHYTVFVPACKQWYVQLNFTRTIILIRIHLIPQSAVHCTMSTWVVAEFACCSDLLSLLSEGRAVVPVVEDLSCDHTITERRDDVGDSHEGISRFLYRGHIKMGIY